MKVTGKIPGTIKPKITALYVYWTIIFVNPFLKITELKFYNTFLH
jgi:hypothetical protein